MNYFYNQQYVDAFRAKINYPKIVKNIEQQPAVYLNWSEQLQQLVIDGAIWSNLEYTSVAIAGDNHAELDTALASGERELSIEIHSFSDKDTVAIFDRMLEMMSITSLPEIAYEHIESGPGSIYLTGRVYNGLEDSSYCIYANMILKVDTVENDLDVRPFIEKLIEIIDVQKQKPDSHLPPFTMSLVTSPAKPMLGDTVTIELKPSVSKDIKVKINFDGLQDVVSLESQTQFKFELKTLKAGDFVIPIRFVDNETLYSGVVTANIRVSD